MTTEPRPRLGAGRRRWRVPWGGTRGGSAHDRRSWLMIRRPSLASSVQASLRNWLRRASICSGSSPGPTRSGGRARRRTSRPDRGRPARRWRWRRAGPQDPARRGRRCAGAAGRAPLHLDGRIEHGPHLGKVLVSRVLMASFWTPSSWFKRQARKFSPANSSRAAPPGPSARAATGGVGKCAGTGAAPWCRVPGGELGWRRFQPVASAASARS